MDIKAQVLEIAKHAHKAGQSLGRVNSEEKNRTLLAMAEALGKQSALLIAENAKDLQQAVQTGLSPAMIDRLTL